MNILLRWQVIIDELLLFAFVFVFHLLRTRKDAFDSFHILVATQFSFSPFLFLSVCLSLSLSLSLGVSRICSV